MKEVVIIALIAMFVLTFSVALATKMVYGFDVAAIIGAKRQARRKLAVVYVSRGPLNPTAVYWLGSEGGQEDLVAAGMVSGEIHRADYSGSVSTELNRKAIHMRVSVWPDTKTRELYGKSQDIAP